MSGYERAVAGALVGGNRRRGKLLVAAERLDLIGAGSAPMVLQDCIGDDPRSDYERRQQKNQRISIEAPQRPTDKTKPERAPSHDGESRDSDPTNQLFQFDKGRPRREHEAVLRVV